MSAGHHEDDRGYQQTEDHEPHTRSLGRGRSAYPPRAPGKHKGAGLVIDRSVGTRRIYALDPDGIGALRAYLDQFWNRSRRLQDGRRADR